MRIFLDLDDVLVDFIGKACRVHGIANPYERKESVGNWDLAQAAGIAPEVFYLPLMGESFWANLPWTADGRCILSAVESFARPRNICLLTAPFFRLNGLGAARSCSGKMLWVRKHLPGYADRLLISATKTFCAAPGHVLIDDYEANIDAFSQAGGSAILVPRLHNRNHRTKDAALYILSRLHEVAKERSL